MCVLMIASIYVNCLHLLYDYFSRSLLINILHVCMSYSFLVLGDLLAWIVSCKNCHSDLHEASVSHAPVWEILKMFSRDALMVPFKKRSQPNKHILEHSSPAFDHGAVHFLRRQPLGQEEFSGQACWRIWIMLMISSIHPSKLGFCNEVSSDLRWSTVGFSCFCRLGSLWW